MPPVCSRWSYEIRSSPQPSSRYQGAGICGATLRYSNNGHHPQERAFRERRSSCLLHRKVVRSASVGHAVELGAKKRAHLEGPCDSLKGAVSSGKFGRAYGTHHARPLARSRGLYGFTTREFTTPNMSYSEVEPPRKVQGIGIKVTRADAGFVKQVHAS